MSSRRPLRFIALFALLALAVFAQQGTYRPYQERLTDGTVDWDEGWIRADASVPMTAGVPPQQARVDAQRVAMIKAQAGALRIAMRIPVNSEQRLESFEALKIRVRGIVAGGRVVSEGLQGNAYRLSLQVPVNGVTGLIAEVSKVTLPPPEPEPPTPAPQAHTPRPQPPQTPSEAPPSQTGLSEYSSVTVEATEAGVKPALQARIVDTNGKEVYGVKTVKPLVARGKTLARYVTPVEGASTSSPWLDPDALSGLPLALASPPWRLLAQRVPTQRPRGQEESLQIKAVAASGPLKADIVVTEETARKLRESARGALSEANIVVVVRADVGGVESRRLWINPGTPELARR